MTTDTALDVLVANGTLKSYMLETEEFEEGSGSGETDKLTLVFPSGETLVINTICSGSLQNTSLLLNMIHPS